MNEKQKITGRKKLMKKKITALFLASVMVLQAGCSATVAMDEKGKVTVDGVPIE